MHADNWSSSRPEGDEKYIAGISTWLTRGTGHGTEQSVVMENVVVPENDPLGNHVMVEVMNLRGWHAVGNVRKFYRANGRARSKTMTGCLSTVKLTFQAHSVSPVVNGDNSPISMDFVSVWKPRQKIKIEPDSGGGVGLDDNLTQQAKTRETSFPPLPGSTREWRTKGETFLAFSAAVPTEEPNACPMPFEDDDLWQWENLTVWETSPPTCAGFGADIRPWILPVKPAGGPPSSGSYSSSEW